MKKILIVCMLGAFLCSCTLMSPKAQDKTVDSTEVVVDSVAVDSVAIDTVTLK